MQSENGAKYNSEGTQDALDDEPERLFREFEEGEPVY